MFRTASIFILIFLIGISARYLYMKPKFDSGETAPNFELKFENGEVLQLADMKGKYVLLEFWGSWCGPCIQEMPGLVKIYDKYNGQEFIEADDFEIIAIAVEKKETRWKKAIEKLDLHWKYHFSDFQYFDTPVIKDYGVREIPSKYLLNEKGEIIGVNLSLEKLDEMLAVRLKT